MKISELVKQAYKNAVNKGFYDCPECEGNGDIPEHDRGLIMCDSCGGSGKNQNKNIGELLMLAVSELGEALEAHRKGKFADFNAYRISSCYEEPLVFESLIKDTFEDELADAVICIADMCGYLGIDLEKHIELKMKYNSTREYKHGKRY